MRRAEPSRYSAGSGKPLALVLNVALLRLPEFRLRVLQVIIPDAQRHACSYVIERVVGEEMEFKNNSKGKCTFTGTIGPSTALGAGREDRDRASARCWSAAIIPRGVFERKEEDAPLLLVCGSLTKSSNI